MDPQKVTIARNSINAGGLKNFSEIFGIISKRSMADQLGVNYTRFRKLLENPKGFRYSEIYAIANILDVQAKQLSDLIHNQLDTPAKPERKKPK